MLFNSPEFLLGFLPITLLGFFLIARSSHRLAALWLASASFFFYCWWDVRFGPLLLGSICFNYAMGYAIGHAKDERRAKALLACGIAADLGLLAYFKYTNFFLATISSAAGVHTPTLNIVLPLGISFFTFTQIAFLVDVSRRIAREYNFIHYLLFVTYFPHLIAGPVLHHKQMMPQFAQAETYSPQREKIINGLAILLIGLAKKVVLADSFAGFASPVFEAAKAGQMLSFFEAWSGALAYTFQLYFDFSGYSDMAIGLSLMFGVQLPLNFDSPYKSRNIIEFWRRWHMTLSQFLRDYLYIPLGGNRMGEPRRYANLLTTMLLGGLWHGANWTFVMWGGLHGLYLAVNHVWQSMGWTRAAGRMCGGIPAALLTFLAVVVAWVFFRADSVHSATGILQGMAGMNGVCLPEQVLALYPPAKAWIQPVGSMALLGNGTVMGLFEEISLLLLGFVICWGSPNTQSMSDRAKLIAIMLSFAFVVQALFFGHSASEFLYFQF